MKLTIDSDAQYPLNPLNPFQSVLLQLPLQCLLLILSLLRQRATGQARARANPPSSAKPGWH